RSVEDQQASQMLLAFSRLLRGPHRRESGMPVHLQAMLKSGLAPRHLGAFAVITLAGPMTVSELARQEGFALSTASLLVTQLAEAGLVERREDTEDRRRTVVSVAPQHRLKSQEVLESKLAPLRRALVRMGPRRTRALLEGIDILVEEVRSGGAPAVAVPARGLAPIAPAGTTTPNPTEEIL
ncbi:MAG TPA: helix-turn-helix domain-containing protein, partial [Acidimicrobiales bacterium]|nr:helix-turn-helix domain-containing protein [Acidimicrobiales bacterium]